jgi:hypothetical protein
MGIRKRGARLLPAFLLVFLLMLSIPMFNHRRAYDEAFRRWHASQTPENLATLQQEERWDFSFRLEFCAISSAVVVAVGYGMFAIVRSLKHRA